MATKAYFKWRIFDTPRFIVLGIDPTGSVHVIYFYSVLKIPIMRPGHSIKTKNITHTRS